MEYADYPEGGKFENGVSYLTCIVMGDSLITKSKMERQSIKSGGNHIVYLLSFSVEKNESTSKNIVRNHKVT